ncbi:hypothetical protein FB567DRAFT_237570 [Paraphoma chrysanthemicola]|uniref:Uncharacterized protein n=1 Tax=Paraphoma chrysanthemicola TaxID=798071 RepID=A0A8K0REP1_9PLEO|nr:hypothetical protein FB567DRAFT_237570 [Paraphoma chrysanthemicola]
MDVHPYVSECERYLEAASYDPMLSEAYLRDLVDYLSLPAGQWPQGDYIREKGPFAWSYAWNGRGEILSRTHSDVEAYKRAPSATGEGELPQILFLAGYSSPSWLNTIGHQFHVDPYFYLRHMSFRPSVQVDSYAEPTLPSASGHVLKLNIPTVGHIDPQVQYPCEDIQTTRQRCISLLKQSFRDRMVKPKVGSSIVRRLYVHDWKRFTFEQEVSMCLLRQGGKFTVIVWTDAGGEDCDPVLPLCDLPAFQSFKYDFQCCPTILRRPGMDARRKLSSTVQSIQSFQTTQTFNLLHRVYGQTLKAECVQSDPFYILSEIYTFAAAAENQFLNMIDQILTERVDSLMLDPDDAKCPKTSDIQYDRSILDAHRNQIKGIITFLTAHDDPAWFQPSQHNASSETTAARNSLLRDFQHLETRVKALILRCERAMEIIMNNASLAEARLTNNQSKELASLTRMTTLVTILYVPLSFVSSFFGMNFKEFGQGGLSLWVWAAVSLPVIISSAFLLRRRLL